VLRSTVTAGERPHSFTYAADARGLHAEHSFRLSATPDGLSTVVVSHETQIGLLPRLGRVVLAPMLRTADRAWLADLAAAADHDGPAAAMRSDVSASVTRAAV
jgi:hypothetical protein